jgi:polar amino acid transport system permease protein
VETLINAFFNLGILRETAPFLWAGFKMSALLTAVVVPLGVAGGLAVALLSRTHLRVVRWLVVAYVDFFRAFPPLVLLMFIAFGLPFTGLELPAFASVALAFLLNTSSY